MSTRMIGRGFMQTQSAFRAGRGLELSVCKTNKQSAFLQVTQPLTIPSIFGYLTIEEGILWTSSNDLIHLAQIESPHRDHS